MTDDASTIDVMVLYTPAAAAAASGGITSLVNNAISIANTTYANSGVTQRLRLVYSGQVNYTESGDNARRPRQHRGRNRRLQRRRRAARHLARRPRLADHADDQLAVLRRRLQALRDLHLVCALGLQRRRAACAVGNLTFPHELGHNMGAGHDWYVDNGVTPQTYAHGFVNPNVGAALAHGDGLQQPVLRPGLLLRPGRLLGEPWPDLQRRRHGRAQRHQQRLVLLLEHSRTRPATPTITAR